MSSKKKILLGCYILVVILINILIFKYNPSFGINGDSYFSMDVILATDTTNDIQFFYSTTDDIYTGFSQENSEVISINEIEQEHELEFSAPTTTKFIRLDFGDKKAQVVIKEIKLKYKKNELILSTDDILNVYSQQMIESIKMTDLNELQISSADFDPFIIWDFSEQIIQLVQNTEHLAELITKCTLFTVSNITFFALILNRKKIIDFVYQLYKNRKLIIRLSINDFKTKYAGSYLGIIWAFIQPIVTVLVYWFVFQIGLNVAKVTTGEGVNIPYVLWFVTGLVPWFFFQDALSNGTSTLLEYSYLVKKVVFDINILPIVKVISALFVHMFFVIFMIVLYAGYGYYPNIYYLQVIYYSVCTFVYAIGLAYAASAIVVFFKDLTQIINIVLQIGIWMTPIMWNIDNVNLPPTLLKIFKLNPMYYIINGYRDTLINKVYFWEHVELTVYFWTVTIILLFIGITIFKKLKSHFADVL